VGGYKNMPADSGAEWFCILMSEGTAGTDPSILSEYADDGYRATVGGSRASFWLVS